MSPGSPQPSGILLVDKPSGPTSYDILRWLKRVVGKQKMGHCGTLDPLASGLLIVLFGKATKTQDLYLKERKTYVCRMKLGMKTNSGDCTGEIIEEKPVPSGITRDAVEKIFFGFLGKREQIPPMFSAVKKDGVPLYKLARKGMTVERKPRAIEIFSLDLAAFQLPDELEFRVHCSHGTYVRTLVEDIGAQLGTVATMKALVRESIGPFHVREALSGLKIKDMTPNEVFSALRQGKTVSVGSIGGQEPI